ncbi:hypothetical protein MTO96_014816 [Rhipicephalus appendiculatus]
MRRPSPDRFFFGVVSAASAPRILENRGVSSVLSSLTRTGDVYGPHRCAYQARPRREKAMLRRQAKPHTTQSAGPQEPRRRDRWALSRRPAKRSPEGNRKSREEGNGHNSTLVFLEKKKKCAASVLKRSNRRNRVSCREGKG